MDPRATSIAAADIDDASQVLEITWEDAHESAYPLKYLRGECPCATCRTAREEAKNNPFRVIGAGERPPSHVVANVEPVGAYGMRIFWDDGHQAGIYTFEYLREICPCEVCRARRREPEAPYVHGIYIPNRSGGGTPLS